MTTNQERAAEIIATATTPPGTSIARGMDRAILATKLIADAGLITPDMQELEWPGSSLVVSGESETLSVETEESEGPRGATQEVEYRIVPTDTNGGKYQTRKWTRMVTEWQPDE